MLSFAGRKEKALSMPDIEILARIANVLNVNADYLIGRTNTTAHKGKRKTVCEFTGLSDRAAEYLSELVKDKDYEKLSIINHLFQELCEDYDFYNYEETAARRQLQVFLVRCSTTLISACIRTTSGKIILMLARRNAIVPLPQRTSNTYSTK